jgi:hypothetical protein
MSNSLVYKVQPTLIVNDVNNNLQNYEVDYSYTKTFSQTAALAAAGTLALASPTTLPATVPFVELISDYAVDLSFVDASAATITSLTSINYFAGNIKGYSFSITNNTTYTANIQWRIYY